MHRSRRAALFALVGLLAVALTSCTSVKDTSTQDTWSSRADSTLRDPDGLGSAAGGTPGTMDLGISGKSRWAIYATCTNADSMQMLVKSGSTVVARTTLTCGTNTRVPVNVDPAAHLSVEINTPGQAAGLPYWFAAVNTPAWTPSTPPPSAAS